MSNKDHDFGSLVCIYSQILPRIRAAGKEMGYAIAIHGTMTRDLDVLAVPWVEEAAEPLALVNMIADVVGGHVIGDRTDERGYISDHPTEAPHGRLSWNSKLGRFITDAVVILNERDTLAKGFEALWDGHVTTKNSMLHHDLENGVTLDDEGATNDWIAKVQAICAALKLVEKEQANDERVEG